MFEIIIMYVVPNVALFGSIWAFSKALEAMTWAAICESVRINSY